jgi:hypothetical protein
VVRVSDHLARSQLAQLREAHTQFGKHVIEEVPFPDSVSEEVAAQALTIDEGDAMRELESCSAGLFPKDAHARLSRRRD